MSKARKGRMDKRLVKAAGEGWIKQQVKAQLELLVQLWTATHTPTWHWKHTDVQHKNDSGWELPGLHQAFANSQKRLH